MSFFPGQIPSADEMNALSGAADSAHIGAAGFLAADNGFEHVVRNPRRNPPAPGAAPAPRTDTAVADADEAAPQNRSVEVREAAAAQPADAEAGTEATPAVPAALQLHDFDAADPEGCGGVSATVTVPEGGGKCDVEFAMPGDTAPASGDITFAARRIDPETGARSLVWLKLGVKPGEEEGDDEGGDDEPEEEPPPCGNPLNGPPSDPTPELDPDTADPYDDPPLAGGDPTPGDGGKVKNPLDYPGDGGFTPTCGGDPNDEAI